MVWVTFSVIFLYFGFRFGSFIVCDKITEIRPKRMFLFMICMTSDVFLFFFFPVHIPYLLYYVFIYLFFLHIFLHLINLIHSYCYLYIFLKYLMVYILWVSEFLKVFTHNVFIHKFVINDLLLSSLQLLSEKAQHRPYGDL